MAFSYFTMPKADFIFYAIILLMLSFYPLLTAGGSDAQHLFALGAILLLGIPHGAIDNSIFLHRSKMSVPRFFALYLGAIGLNIAVWFVLPQLAYVLFLGLSAYHFGQSQWTDIKWKGERVLYLSWGSAVILTYLTANRESLHSAIADADDLSSFAVFFHAPAMHIALAVSFGLALGCILFLAAKRRMRTERILRELFIFGLVAATAVFFDFLFGFALFFVTVHAFKVMQSEYGFFRSNALAGNVFQFIKALLPLSLLSIVGIVLLMVLVHFEWLQLSYPFLFMVVISSITVPHAYVMERFYRGA